MKRIIFLLPAVFLFLFSTVLAGVRVIPFGVTNAGGGGASFPQVATTGTSFDTSSTGTHTVTLPTGIQSGETLVAVMSCDGAITTTWPGAWTIIYEQDSGANTLIVAWAKGTGSEGASISVDSSVSEKAATIVYRITGATDPATTPPEAQATESTGSDASPDPLSLTPTGGSKNYLWIAGGGNDAASVTLSAYPANYTSNQQDVAATGGGDVRVYTATRENAAASENPGVFTISTSASWEAVTIAVHPA